MGNLALFGKDRDTWGASDEPINPHSDLLTIASSGKRDPFSAWCSQRFIRWFYQIFWHRLKPDDPEAGIVSYENQMLQKYTSYITTIVASLLPILAIVVLYCVASMNARLGVIGLFTVIFTVCLCFFTHATRGEIFIATST
jgi:hypothetical protein